MKQNKLILIQYTNKMQIYLRAIINDDTIPKLKCKVIVGSANNVPKESHHRRILK